MLDYDQGSQVADLRLQLRRLIADNLPPDYLGAFTDDPADLEVAQAFCRLLAEESLLCAAWPEQFGGRASSPWEQTAVREEMWAHHEPRGAQYMGVNWVGPTIMRHGTTDQQRQHLPPIAAGEVIWCQGFSEPDAGSDLASLQTAARRDGDGWRIRGQKIWTSYATMAQWCFLLARTSRGERKQQGITVFLVPMDAPGIEVRPIPCMLGPHHLNEVFLDDVCVTEADVLGEIDQGWNVVREVLAFERVGIARYARVERLLQWAPAALGEAWDRLPDELRSRWTRMLVHARRARLLAYRVIATQQTGEVQPGDTAAYRIAVTRLDQESAEVLMDIAAELPPSHGVEAVRAAGASQRTRGDLAGGRQLDGPPSHGVEAVRAAGASQPTRGDLAGGQQLDGPPSHDVASRFRRAVEDHHRYSVSATVASGSIEMQRILLARALLAAA